VRRIAVAAVLLAAAGCGREGPPVPPVIRVAQRTTDLAVVQEGTEAVLTWSWPRLTTAGGPLEDVEAVEVWRLQLPPGQRPGGGARDRRVVERIVTGQGERIAVLDRQALERATRGDRLEYRDDLAAWYAANRERMPLVLHYAVRTVCCRGRASELSNLATLAPQPPPRAPAWAGAEAREDGIALSWEGEGPVLVERSPDGKRWRRITPEPVRGGSWVDRGASQGRTWRYRLRAVREAGGSRVVGGAGEPLEVAYPDVYPPDPPAELVCLPEPEAVRLRWRASPGAASYKVFRRRGSGAWVHLHRGFTGLEYVDAHPPAGALTYAVKAVDAAGNESEAATCTATVAEGP